MKTLLDLRRKSRPANKKRDWNAAIQHYNLPTNGIEVRIPGDHKPKTSFTSKISSQPTAASTPKPLRYFVTRSLFIASGLATLGNIPVYSMVSSTPYSPALEQTINPVKVLKDLNLPDVAVESYSGYSVELLPDVSEGNWKTHTIADKDTLQTALQELNMGNMAKALQGNADIAKELGNLKQGTHLFAQIIEGQLQKLIYAAGKTKAYVISNSDDGFKGKWENDVFEIRNSRIAFTVKHSIQRDGKIAGLSTAIIRQLPKVFHKDIDFRKGVKVGDKVGVIFEDYQYQGESIYTDEVIAGEYHSRNNTWQRIRFTLADGKTDYFSPDSDTELKRTAFDRTPVAGARMSSGFGIRRHPVFGFRKSHAGVDYAAARGTPIHATADGSVKFMGRQRGYGNVIELRHGSGVTTLYGHMSGFKSGLGSGKSVKRGDVIGYVGSTGTSTGNHVHYEYRINGAPQNPATVKLPQTGIMTASEAHSFKTLAANMREQLANLRKLASLDKPIKQQHGG